MKPTNHSESSPLEKGVEKQYTQEEVENILQWCAQRLVKGVASNYGKRELEWYNQQSK